MTKGLNPDLGAMKFTMIFKNLLDTIINHLDFLKVNIGGKRKII